MILLPEMYIKIYKRKKQKGTFAANVVKRSAKKGKAVKILKTNVNV